MIKKYTHKPTEIEAVQFTGDNLDEVIKFIGITGDYLIIKDGNNYKIEQRGIADLLYSNSLVIRCGEYVTKNNGKIEVVSNLDDYVEIPQYSLDFWKFETMPFSCDFRKVKITQPTDDKLTQIADYYGKEKQSQKTVEELAELIQAIVKYEATPDFETKRNLTEELADVKIMIDQMLYLCEIPPYKYNDMVEFKIARTLQRIAEESNHVGE
jgi:hypothetical protein